MPADDAVLTLREYLRPLRIRWWLILGVTLLLAAVGVVIGLQTKTKFTATTKLYIETPTTVASILGSTDQVSTNYVADQATLMTSALQSQRVQQALGYTAPATAAQIGITDFIDLSVTAANRVQAVNLANEYARQYRMATSKTEKLQATRELTSLRRQYAALDKVERNGATGSQLQSEIQQVQTLDSAATGVASIVNPATATETNKHRDIEYGVFGGVAGLIASILVAYMLQGLDPRLRGAVGTGDVYPFPVLCAIPHDGHIDDMTTGVATFAVRSREAFRDLRVAMELADDSDSDNYRVIAVCSAMPGEGKTSVARGLALAYAEIGRNVAIVDLDLRRARLAERLGIPTFPGVSDVVVGTALLEDAKSTIQILSPSGHRRRSKAGGSELMSDEPGFGRESTMTVVPPGTRIPNAQAVVESARLPEIIAALREEHDVVIIDTAPIVPVSDALPILRHVDATLIVARSGVTDKRSARLATTALGRINDLTVAGVVVNDLATSEAVGYGSAYGPKYGYA